MNWQYTSLTPLLGLVALGSFIIAIVSWRRRPVPGSTPLAMSMLCVGIWSLSYAVQLAAIDIQINTFWGQVKFLGIVFLPLAWLYLSVEYNGPEKWLTKPRLALLAIIPVATLLLVWTNQLHGLIWSRIRFEEKNGLVLQHFEHGAGFWLFTAYAFLLLTVSTILFLHSLIRARPAYRKQIRIMVAGALIPWIGMLLHPAKLTPIYPVDLAPFAFALSGLLAIWGLSRGKLFDLVPVQHKAILEGIQDCIIVLDAQNRILEANSAAQKLFSQPIAEAIGQVINQVWSEKELPLHCLNGNANDCNDFDDCEVTLTLGEETHVYSVRRSTLSDDKGALVNRVVVFHDITSRKQASAMLNQTRSDLEVRNQQIDIINQQLQEELNVRIRAEEALRTLNQELESRVSQRTAELTASNVDLVGENDQHKQTEQELLQRNRELLSLQAAAAATATSLDIPFVLDTVTWEMVNLLNVEGCSILEWNKPEGKLTVIADYAAPVMLGPEKDTVFYALEDYPQRKHVLNEQQTWQMVVTQTDLNAGELAYMQQSGLKTLLMLPMVFQDRVVGLVEITDSGVERAFTDHEISLMQLLANQAASAIENARLYQRAQQEIEERMRAEERIKASLKEKEVLLKEIHHRVKNNLQVITSLLRLQSQSIKDPSAMEMFQESQHRIRSMALIHEKLYRSQDLARIDFGDYIRNLTSYLVRSYRRGLGPISLKINAQNVTLSIESAVPCGLIINELVSNALKHAFPIDAGGRKIRQDGKPDEIIVELSLDSQNMATLAVQDNGVGFPDDVDYKNTDSLGMQLITTLTEQLDGTVTLNSNAGTEFSITFPVT